jgi:hypothetical protein
MTPEEEKEFTALKYARAEQGFFTPEQQERWNYLHKLQGDKVLRLIKIMEEKRKMRLN